MSATVHVLHPKLPSISGFLRVGHTGHRKLEELIAANRIRFQRFVFDAAHLEEQKDLLHLLQKAGCEIILDPNTAEMAAKGRFDSSVSKLPWGNPDRPWQPDDFGKSRNLDTAKAIAEFAVKYDVDAILSPAHFADEMPSPWTIVDLRICEELRHELDRAGGSHVAIDYQIVTTNTFLKEKIVRDALVANIRHLPIENVWLRASGFGASATGAATRAFIESARGFHELNRPIIADYAGGFSALAAAAFGAVGGFCHGVAQKENFRISEWEKPAKGGGGSAKRIYIPELDRAFKSEQLSAFFGIKGTRARFVCNDTKCCPHGTEDMIENPHRHFIIQRSKQIEALANVPEKHRAEHFLLHQLDPAVRSARFASRLKIENDEIVNIVTGAKKRLDHLRDPLGDLHTSSHSASRSADPTFRGENLAANKAVGK